MRSPTRRRRARCRTGLRSGRPPGGRPARRRPHPARPGALPPRPSRRQGRRPTGPCQGRRPRDCVGTRRSSAHRTAARSKTRPVVPCEAPRRPSSEPPLEDSMRSNRRPAGLADDLAINPMFTQDVEQGPVPRDRFPSRGMLPDTAYQLIHDELLLDGNSRQNVATFGTTWMEPQAQALMAETLDKNMIDKDEYPQTAELETRCVRMLADLWHAPSVGVPGVSTVGSSEACMLGGLALKRRWQERSRAAGLSTDRPNMVAGANVQVVWDKFFNYFEVEPRLVPLEGDRLHLGAAEAATLCDENTIGVVGILGSTMDGSYEPIAEIAAALDGLQARTGLDIPIHVDGASGAMVAPFLEPDLGWDFRLPRVASISTSGHKYGLVYPGVGWVIWRDQSVLPEDLVFHVNYLGGDMGTFTLNFSRPGSQVVAQYYTFLRLGFEGYRRVQQTCRDVAMRLAAAIEGIGPYELLSRGDELPVFAFQLNDAVTNFTVFDVSRRMRERGWQVPAYTMPPNREDLAVLRVVVRNGMSSDLAALFLADLVRFTAELERQPAPGISAEVGFRH